MGEWLSAMPYLAALMMLAGVGLWQPQRGLDATWVFLLVWAIWVAGERARGGQ